MRDCNVLFDLPDQLLMHVLDVWLELPNKPQDLMNAVHRTAVCRSVLTNLFTSADGIFHCHVGNANKEELPYAMKLGMRMSCVSIDRMEIERKSIRKQVLQYLAPTLKRLNLDLTSSFDHNQYANYNGSDDESIASQNGDEHREGVEIMKDIFSAFPLLEHFDLERSMMRDQYIKIYLTQSFCELFTKCTHLQSLCLHGCVITSTILKAMCNAPNLREISILHESSFKSNAFDDIAPVQSSSVRRIKTNHVQFCALFPDVETLLMTGNTSIDIISVATHCRNVLNATVALTSRMDEVEAQQMCQHWQNVRNLTFTSIKTLENRLSKAATITIIQQCCHLHRFYTDASLRNMWDFNVTFPQCVHAKYFKGSRLRELHVDVGTEDLLELIVTHCTSLFALHIRRCEYSIYRALRLLNNTSVKCLQLVGCQRLCDSDIEALQTIETLHIHDGCRLTKQGIINLGKNCRTLRALYLTNAIAELADAVIDLIPVCPSLQRYIFEFACSSSMSYASAALSLVQQMFKARYPHVLIVFDKPRRDQNWRMLQRRL